MRSEAYESTQQRSNSSVGKGRRKKVTFGHIDIFEHAVEMGDNPSVSDGAPITIGWTLQRKSAYGIAYFETYFPSEDRRRKQSLKLTAAHRAKILLCAGYSMYEIMECTLAVMKEKHIRIESLRSRKWDNWNALVEKTTRKLRKATVRPRRVSLRGSSPARNATNDFCEYSAPADVCPSSPSTFTLTLPPFTKSPVGHQPLQRASIDLPCSDMIFLEGGNRTVSTHLPHSVPFSPNVSPEKSELSECL